MDFINSNTNIFQAFYKLSFGGLICSIHSDLTEGVKSTAVLLQWSNSPESNAAYLSVVYMILWEARKHLHNELHGAWLNLNDDRWLGLMIMSSGERELYMLCKYVRGLE